MENFRNTDRGQETQAASNAVTLDQNEIGGLVKRAAGGDIEAFGRLYSIFLDRIYRYAFYHVKDRMTAEDITEEVFLKAWKAINTCKGREKTFLPWLYRIAHNHIIDIFRSQKELPAKMETIAEVSDHRQRVETRLEHQLLLDEIACLPQNQRQVIMLKFVEGFDNREIGQVMHRKQGAIRVLQMRALATLRRRLSEDS